MPRTLQESALDRRAALVDCFGTIRMWQAELSAMMHLSRLSAEVSTFVNSTAASEQRDAPDSAALGTI